MTAARTIKRAEPAGKREVKRAKLIARGKKYFDRKDWPNAAKYYVAAWDLAPEDKDLLVVVSHLLVQLGVREKAILVLEKALEVNGPTREVLSILGEMAAGMGMSDIAEKLYRIFIESFPGETSGYNGLANALGGQDRHDESINLLQEVLPIFPEDANLWNTLAAHVGLRDGFEAALVFYHEAHRLVPDDYRIANNLARAYERLGDFENGLDWGLKAVELNPDDPEPRIGLGLTSLLLGRLGEGWDNYAERHNKKRSKDVVHYTHGLKELTEQPVEGKSVLAVSEQGVADEMLFGMALPQLYEEAEQLYIGCDKRLIPVYQRTFPNAVIAPAVSTEQYGYIYRGYPEIEKRVKSGEIHIDYAIPFGNVTGRYWRSLDTIPEFPDGYLKLDDEIMEKWRSRVAALGDRPKIGIAWRSGKMTAERNTAYLKIEELEPILRTEGVIFVNLQYGECSDELAEAKERFGIDVVEWDDLNLKDDFDDIFALMKNLDHIISPASAPAMMAMVAGADIWWLLRGKPWYAFGTDRAVTSPKSSYFLAGPTEPWDATLKDVASRLEKGRETGEFKAD